MSNSLDPDQARHFVGPDLGFKLFAKVIINDTRVTMQNISLQKYWLAYKILVPIAHD